MIGGQTVVCLSLDVDWAHDDVLRDTLGLLEDHRVKADWFVTHQTPVLREIRLAGHRLGLHPNFNGLLQRGAGWSSTGDAADVLDRCMELAPDARCIRSHSLTRSSRLSALFLDRGFTHESNLLIPPAAAPHMNCWRDCSGLIAVPIRWEDDVRHIDPSIGDAAEWVGRLKLLTVDFHPVHLFLNTVVAKDYEAARGELSDPAALSQRRRPAGSGGSRDQLTALLAAIAQAGISPTAMADLRPSTLANTP